MLDVAILHKHVEHMLGEVWVPMCVHMYVVNIGLFNVFTLSWSILVGRQHHKYFMHT